MAAVRDSVAFASMGADLSAAHAGFCLLHDGSLVDHHFVTDKKGRADLAKQHGTLIAPGVPDDSDAFPVARIAWWRSFLSDLLDRWEPNVISLEDYAEGEYGASLRLAEISGQLRELAWSRGIPLRLHDAPSVKMWATGKGDADKDGVRNAALTTLRKTHPVVARAWESWDIATTGKTKGQRVKSYPPCEDMADSFTLAQMAAVEAEVRAGRVQLSSLTQGQIRVFNRATKARPVNLLGRDWIVRTEAK